MNFITIIAIIWVLLVSIRIIQKEKKRGIIVISFIAIAALISVLGKKFGYDGDAAAIVLAVLFTIGVIWHNKRTHGNQK